MNKYYEEKAKKLGLQLFIEKVGFHVEPSQVEEFPSAKLEESANGKSEWVVGIVKSAPISKFSENLNGRIYSRELWEAVANSKIAEGSYCLAGHPPDNEDDDPRRMFGIWKNIRVLENVVVADLHVLKCEEGIKFFGAIKTGGRNGLSSVGYGELLSDGKTVNPKSYIIERYGDWVLNPSQQVFATLENIQESVKEPELVVQASTNITSTKLEESSVEENKRKTEIMSDNVMQKIGEANLKNIVKNHIKEAKSAMSAKDLAKMQEKIKDVKEQLDIVPFEEEKSKLSTVLAQLEETMEHETSAMKDEHADLKDKLDKTEKEAKDAKEMCESLQKKLRKASEIIEKLGGTAETPDSLKVVEAMQDDIEKFTEDRKNMQADIDVLMKERADMLADIAIFKEERVAMKSDIDVLMKERADMLSDIEIFKEERVVMQSDIKALVEDTQARDLDIKNLLEDRVTMLEDINKLVIDRKNMKADIKGLKEQVKKAQVPAKPKFVETELDDLGPYPFQEQPVDEKISVPLTSEAESVIVDPAIRRRATNMVTPDQLESLEAPRGSKLSEASTGESAVIRKAIAQFYESKVKEFPGIARSKAQILGATSVNEAVEIYEAMVKNSDPVIKIQESTSNKKKPSWLQGYK